MPPTTASSGGPVQAGATLAVAHDLNHLLAVVLATAEHIRDRSCRDPAELSQLISDLAAATSDAVDLVAELTSTPPPQSRTAVGAALRSAQPLLSAAAAPAGLRLDVAPSADGLEVTLSRTQLVRVLLNLVVNSRDALSTSPGAGCAPVAISVSPEPGHVVVTVRDAGPGIPYELQSHVFEREMTTKGPSGAGLGLATVRELASSCGGTVTIVSGPGAGTAVTLRLPASPAGHPPDPSARQGRVLLVEDDPRLRRAFTTVLSGHFELTSCGSVRHATELLTAETWDVLVTDLALADGSGLALLEHAAGLPAPPTPVVVSGTASAPTHSPAGTATWLRKPCRPTDLVAAVAAAARAQHPST